MTVLIILTVVSFLVLLVSVAVSYLRFNICGTCGDDDDEEENYHASYYYTKDTEVLYDARVILSGTTIFFLVSAAARFFNVSYSVSLITGLLYGAIIWSAISIARIHKWRLIY